MSGVRIPQRPSHKYLFCNDLASALLPGLFHFCNLLHEDGWIVKPQVGSHVQLVQPLKSGKVIVPQPRKDLALGTVKSIAGQAGISLEE